MLQAPSPAWACGGRFAPLQSLAPLYNKVRLARSSGSMEQALEKPAESLIYLFH
jgi:hypothetical protein